jgi:hypothetical protein
MTNFPTRVRPSCQAFLAQESYQCCCYSLELCYVFNLDIGLIHGTCIEIISR